MLLIGKRRRHTTSDFSEQRQTEQLEESKPKVKRGPGRPPKQKSEVSKSRDDDDEDIDVCGLDDENDDVFPEKYESNSFQKYEQTSNHSKNLHDSEKKKSKQKQKEVEYSSSESDSEQGNGATYNHLNKSKLFKLPRKMKRKFKHDHRLKYRKHGARETYSDCRLHKYIPPLDDEDDVTSGDGDFSNCFRSPDPWPKKQKKLSVVQSKTAAGTARLL